VATGWPVSSAKVTALQITGHQQADGAAANFERARPWAAHRPGV
jgi:hypothetical protein